MSDEDERERLFLHVCRAPHEAPGLTEEQREIVANEWNRGEGLAAAMLASAYLERNRQVEPPLCTRPDCKGGVVEVTDEDGFTWAEPCPMCRANERWRIEYGYLS